MLKIIGHIIIGYVISLDSVAVCARTLNCSFETDSDYAALDTVYRCEVSSNPNITSPDDTLIESTTGSHKSGQNNSDVEAFHVAHKTIHFFPAGLDKVFSPNLKAIRLLHCGLKEIHQSDLKPFPKMVYVDFWINQIEILEEGLFAFNPELAVAVFKYNELVHIDSKIFNHLTKLTYLGLEYNNCIELSANNATALEVIKKELITICKDEEYLKLKSSLDEIESDVENPTVKAFLTIDTKIGEAGNELKSSKFANYTTFSKQLEKILASQSEIKKLENQLFESNGILTNATAVFEMEIEMLKKQDRKLMEKVGKLEKEGSKLKEQKLMDQVKDLQAENRKLDEKLEQSVFNLKVMCYMIVIFCGPLMMIWLLAVYEYGGAFCKRRGSSQADEEEEEENSPESSSGI